MEGSVDSRVLPQVAWCFDLFWKVWRLSAGRLGGHTNLDRMTFPVGGDRVAGRTRSTPSTWDDVEWELVTTLKGVGGRLRVCGVARGVLLDGLGHRTEMSTSGSCKYRYRAGGALSRPWADGVKRFPVEECVLSDRSRSHALDRSPAS